MRRRAGACLCAALIAACGSSTSAPPLWRSSHPDPQGMTFDEQAPGLCALTVQYPDDAPAAIEFGGQTYVQHDRIAAPASLPGQVLAHSGGWTLSTVAGGIDLDTGSYVFHYSPESGC